METPKGSDNRPLTVKIIELRDNLVANIVCRFCEDCLANCPRHFIKAMVMEAMRVQEELLLHDHNQQIAARDATKRKRFSKS